MVSRPSTSDFIREEDGKLDQSFGDFYIDCKNDIEIKHGVDDILSCYIPSIPRGKNVLKKIYTDNIKKDPDKITIEAICKKLLHDEILTDIDITDGEVYFTFKNTKTEYIASLVGARTSGITIQPFSIKNLPKTHYEIPKSDIDRYTKFVKTLPKKIMTKKDKDGKEIKIEMADGALIMAMMRDFEKIILEYKSKKFNINEEQKKSGIRGKEFIHSIGLWDEFLEFMKNYQI